MKSFDNKKVVIIGGAGGLGKTYARELLKEGAHVFLGGRNLDRLESAIEELGETIEYASVDLADVNSIEVFAKEVEHWNKKIDFVINATGMDVRKALQYHSNEEIQNSIGINLTGSIILTKIMLPLIGEEKGNAIVHMGGFGDGTIAFPYYTADVASRAGLHAFAESLNRELKQEKRKVRIIYFCPNSADTEAERPFHPIWKEMNIAISTPEQVWQKLRIAVLRGKTSYQMGMVTRLFSKINGLSPRFGDIIALNSYSRILQKHLSPHGMVEDNKEDDNKKLKWKGLAVAFIVLSFLIYVVLPFNLCLPFSGSIIAALTAGMMIVSEIIFWIGCIILGKELASKYRSYLNPMNWIHCLCRK